MGGVNKNASSGGGFLDSILGGITTIGNAASSALSSWGAIQQKKLDLQLQNAQVQAEINKIQAQKAAAQAAINPLPASSTSKTGGLSLNSIPPWMLVAGAFVALFTLKGMVK